MGLKEKGGKNNLVASLEARKSAILSPGLQLFVVTCIFPKGCRKAISFK